MHCGMGNRETEKRYAASLLKNGNKGAKEKRCGARGSSSGAGMGLHCTWRAEMARREYMAGDRGQMSTR